MLYAFPIISLYSFVLKVGFISVVYVYTYISS